LIYFKIGYSYSFVQRGKILEILKLASKIFIGFISLFFLFLSIYDPGSKSRGNETRLLERIAIVFYFVNLMWAVGVFFHSFSIYWGFSAVLLMLTFVIWILRENDILEVYLTAKFQRSVKQQPIEELYLNLLQENWEKILTVMSEVDFEIQESSKNHTHLFLLGKSYALIKLNRAEEAMSILFEILDGDQIELEIKEGIKYHLNLIQKQSLIA
jgi:hypothetical protein